MSHDISKITQFIIDEFRDLEPSQTEVCADHSSETRITYENTDFSMASSGEATVFGIRTIVNNRLGFITTNSLDEAELKIKAREAQQVARLSPESLFHMIAEKQPTAGSFELIDSRIAEMQPKELLKWTDLLVTEACRDPRVALDRAEFSVGSSTRIIQNSNGVSQKMEQAVCGWSVMGMAKDQHEVTSFDYDGSTVARWGDLEKAIISSAKEFRESVIGSLKSRTAKSYKGPVLFHPAAVGALLASVVGTNVNARAQQDGMSKWKDSLGQTVASPKLNITENPLDESRPAGWMPFDREGVLTHNREIIRHGVLKFAAHNCFTAKRGQTKPTGNAVGGARGVPAIGLSNLTIEAGETSEAGLYKELKTGLVIKRFSGNSDPVSGLFSGVAKNSWWVENGQKSHPLREVMVQGNMFELLKNILLVGNQLYRQFGSFDSPYILIDGLSVTGS